MLKRDRRPRVLGVPVGRRSRRSGPGAGWAGAGLVAAAATVPLAQRASRTLAHGRDMAGQAGEAVDKARSFEESVASHSTVIGKFGAVISEARKLGKSGGDSKPRLAHLIEEHTDIAAPRSVVYNQWTQMEMFPSIVKGVQSVDQRDDDQAEWTSKIGPVRRTWNARITEQVPDERIAWQTEGGPRHEGVVSFHTLDEQLTRVLVQIQYKPSGPLEKVGNTLRIQRRRVRRDLRMFKHFVELRGEETGAWRGRIGADGPDEESGGEAGTRSGSRRQAGTRSGARREAGTRSGTRSDSDGAKDSGSSAPARSSRSAGTKRARPSAGAAHTNGGSRNGGGSRSGGSRSATSRGSASSDAAKRTPSRPARSGGRS